MPSRVLSILVGATVVAAGSTTGSATCSGNTCSSCVTADGANSAAAICVNFTAPAPPTCVACNNLCSMSPCSSNCNATCSVCVPSLTPVGFCLTATAGTGYILGSSTSLSFGLDAALDFGVAFNGATLVTANASVNSNVTVDGSAVVKLASNIGIGAVTLGSTFASSAMVLLDTSASVDVWTNNAGRTKVENNCSNLVVAKLDLGGAAFSVYQTCPTANVTFAHLDFTPRGTLIGAATLRVAGGVARFNLGGDANITGSGTISLSGGVAAEGYIPANVNVDVSAQSNAPLVSIDANKEFNVAANMTADAAGTVAVYGKLAFGAATRLVNAKVIVNAGASLVFNSTSSCQAKSVDVAASATLEIGANVKSATLALGQFVRCLGAVKIHLDATFSAFANSSYAGSAVAFSYTGGNPTELAKCTVQLVDSTGAVITLTSRAGASAGRRLLQSGGSATWTDSSMTYSTNSDSTSGAVAVALAPVVIGFLALLA